MALQTGVFENGQWVTRRVSIQDILQQNRQRESEQQQQQPPFRPPMEQPVVGLLSRTVLQSPVINWIIPARVRNREKNDVVLIGEDFIHLKEIMPNAHLEHVTTKADFGSRIRAARVFGEPRKFIHPPMTEKAQSPMDIDWNEVVPPQILVLTLESQELLFLFARPKLDGSVEWKESCIPLAPDASLLEQPGKHLAVDPRSRALAVGASESSILIYSAKTMPELRSNFSHDTQNWTPLKAERPVGIPGTILKMEFLYPEPEDDHNVIFLVIYSKGGDSKMSCYEWDHRQGLANIRPIVEAYPLTHDQRNPQLLIPLQHGPSFILVGHQDIHLHQDIMSGSPKKSSVSLSKEEAPRYPGNSRRAPTWTSWARTGRNWIWNKKQEENFYLVREDGVVHYMQVNPRSGALTSKAGHFSCNVASAFASLDVGYYLDTPDVLVTCGDMSPGEIVKIGQWRDEISFNDRKASPSRQRTRAQIMEPDFINAIQNWSPTLDLILTDAPATNHPINGVRKRILATCGRTPHGAITEIRAGLNAKLGLAFEDADLGSVTGLWSLPDSSEDGIYFLLSLPSSSVLIHIAADASEVETDFDEESCGVFFENETLTASVISRDLAVQVTSKALIVLDTLGTAQTLPRKGIWELAPEESILTAAICSELSTVYVALGTADGFSLHTKRIVLRDEDVKFESTPVVDLRADPTCIRVLTYQSASLLLVATTDGAIQLYEIRAYGEVGRLLGQYHIDESDSTQGTLSACQSAVLLQDKHSRSSRRPEVAIVCGLRNGDLYVIELSSDTLRQQNGSNPSNGSNGAASTTSTKKITLGHTPAMVIHDSEGGPSLAFATCGSEFYRLDYSDGRAPGLEVTNIWFTDRNRPELRQSPVSAVCRIPRENYLARDLGGALVCISGTSFGVAQLEEEKHMVPRSIPVSGTPNRVIYSEGFKALFAACVEPHVFRVNGRNGGQRRYAQSYIRMYDDRPSSTTVEPIAEYALPPGSRVNSLSEWALEEDGKRYAQIVIGTVEGDGRRGRVLFIAKRASTDGTSQLASRKELSFKQQVTAIAKYGDTNHLVVCFGTKLQLYRYSARRIHCVGEHNLPSPGLYITTEAPFVYVSTACDSLMVLKATPVMPSEDPDIKFELLFTDRQARDTSFHLPLDLPQLTKSKGKDAYDGISDSLESSGFTGSHAYVSDNSSSTQDTPSTNLVLISDKAGSLTLLHIPRLRTHQTAAPTLLEASLPRSIMRIRRGAIRPTLQHHNNSDPDDHTRSATAATGVLVNDIIGVASDGTLFGVSLVKEKAWRLLRFIQNVCSLLDRERRAQRPGGMLVPLVNLGPAKNLVVGPVRYLDSDDETGTPESEGEVDGTATQDGMDLDDTESESEDDMDLDDGAPTSAQRQAFPRPPGPFCGPESVPGSTSAFYQTPGATHAHAVARGAPRRRSADALLRALDPDKDVAGLKRRTAYHVDGDALVRFLGRGGEALLRRMMVAICDGDAGSRRRQSGRGDIGGGESEVRRRFVDLVREALGPELEAAAMEVDGEANGVGGRDVELDAAVKKVVDWLREMLAPVL